MKSLFCCAIALATASAASAGTFTFVSIGFFDGYSAIGQITGYSTYVGKTFSLITNMNRPMSYTTSITDTGLATAWATYRVKWTESYPGETKPLGMASLFRVRKRVQQSWLYQTNRFNTVPVMSMELSTNLLPITTYMGNVETRNDMAPSLVYDSGWQQEDIVYGGFDFAYDSNGDWIGTGGFVLETENSVNGAAPGFPYKIGYAIDTTTSIELLEIGGNTVY